MLSYLSASPGFVRCPAVVLSVQKYASGAASSSSLPCSHLNNFVWILIGCAWLRHPVLPASQRTPVRLVAVNPGFLAMLAAKHPRSVFIPPSVNRGILSYHVGSCESTGNFWFCLCASRRHSFLSYHINPAGSTGNSWFLARPLSRPDSHLIISLTDLQDVVSGTSATALPRRPTLTNIAYL